MIELDRHIEILLLSNDCVIVPNLGGFMAHHVNARYDENDSTFLPPLRTLGFNPKLKLNDSLLVQSYIEAYDLSYPEALRRIEGEVAELRQHIETDGMFELNDIGVLRLNEEGNIEFEPCEAGILTPELYGLSTFEMKPLVVDLPEEPEEQSDSEVIDEDTNEPAITIRMSWLRNVVAVAAAVLAFFMIGTPISNSNVQESSFIRISSSYTQKVSDSTDNSVITPTEENTLDTEVASVETEQTEAVQSNEEQTTEEQVTEEQTVVPTPTTPTYCIVLASQVSKRNAANFVDQLKEAGFAEASVMEDRMVRVVYGTYASEADAYNSLRSLRSQSRHFKEGWVMKVTIK